VLESLAVLVVLAPELIDSDESVLSVFWRLWALRSLMVQMYLAPPADNLNWMPLLSRADCRAEFLAAEAAGAAVVILRVVVEYE
jgi:hypothetical protein